MRAFWEENVEQLPTENGRAVWIDDMGTSRVRILEDTAVRFTGHAGFEIRADGDGCVVTCSNTSTIRSGTRHVPFFRGIVGLLGGSKSGCKDHRMRLSGDTGQIEWID